MEMDQKPTPDQLERARQISADIVAKVDCPLRDKYLDGRCDHSHAVKAALTAIIQSDQQQAELKTHAEAMAGALDTAMQWIKAWDVGFLFDEEWPEDEAKINNALTAFREWQGGRING